MTTSTKRIGIIETGAGNVASLHAAIERAGRIAVRLNTPQLDDIDQLVIPGQGRFGPVMQTLKRAGWLPALQLWFNHNRPLLGICVGLQVLFEASEEDVGIHGLGFLRGEVRRLKSPKQPMTGWAAVDFVRPDADERAINEQDGDAYFVNSFVVPDCKEAVAWTEYGERFCAVIRTDAWLACQFHPEKSGRYGAELLNQWLVS